MKSKKLLLCVLVVALSMGVTGKGVFIRLKAGWGYLAGGTYNDYSEAFRVHWQKVGEQYSLADIAFEPVHSGLDLSGEIGFHLNPRFSIALGGGFLRAMRENRSKLIRPGQTSTDDETITIHAVPIQLTLTYRVPLGGKSALLLGAGPSVYIAKLQLDRSGGINTWSYSEQTTSQANFLGFDVSAGWEVELTKRLSLVLECGGRYAKSGELKADFSENGALKYQDFSLYYLRLTGIPMFMVYDKPSGSGFSEVTPAVVDLSGFALRAGIKISL